MAKKETANKKVEETNEETVKVEQPITPTVDASPDVNEKSVDTNPETKDEPKEEPVVEKSVFEKSVEELADEVDAGVYGSGRDRMTLLGSRYFEVQQEVNRRWIANGRK